MEQTCLARIGVLLLFLLQGTDAQGGCDQPRAINTGRNAEQFDNETARRRYCFLRVGYSATIRHRTGSNPTICDMNETENVVSCDPYCDEDETNMEIYPVYYKVCASVSRVLVTLTPLDNDGNGGGAGNHDETALHDFQSPSGPRFCQDFMTTVLNMGLLDSCMAHRYQYNITAYDRSNQPVFCDFEDFRFFSRRSQTSEE